LKVLLVADEYFSWGVYGGFGAFTRKLGSELVKRGVEVDAYVHKISRKQRPVGEIEVIDGVHVKTLPRGKVGKMVYKGLYVTDAEVIHSQSGMLDTYLAFKRNENCGKLVTVQDLRTQEDLKRIGTVEKLGLAKKLSRYLTLKLYGHALCQADRLFVQAELLAPKVHELFNRNPSLLPNFVEIPKGNMVKADVPTVVWLGRLDSIKRPHLCFDLAKRMPNIQFYILGKSHSNLDYASDPYYRDVKNLHFMGFQDGKVKEMVLSRAWILINTSIYECLPVSFLEVLAHKCALLSTQNPDSYTERFGMYVKYPELLEKGLEELLYADNWRYLGEKGYEHVCKVHSLDKCVQDHINIYKELSA